MVVRPSRAVSRHDVAGLHGLVKLAHAAFEFRPAENIAVGEALCAERVEKRLLVLPRQGKKFIKGDGVNAGLGDIVLRAVLILVHPLFHGKGFDLHVRNPPIKI